jgi:hypothetical protein
MHGIKVKIKLHTRILGVVYDNEKEKGIYAIVKNPTITETIRLHTR